LVSTLNKGFNTLREALHDQTLIVLMIAAAVEVAIGLYEIIHHHKNLALIDGGAIIIASMLNHADILTYDLK
jgi:hypothetical protein